MVRTLDAGADKPLPALPMPPEANPFLGVRGIRLTLERPDVLATQLRAILRVAAEHPVKVMLPMVATVDEIESARTVLAQARADTGIDVALEFGIMVEVPAAALTARSLAQHVDFFSLGTNDLTQYTMAAERGSERLAPLLTGPQPAVLRLVQETVAGARAHGRWVGVCGELAGDPPTALLFAGLGVTELSMAPALVPEVKEALRGVTLADAQAAARQALEADSAAAARALRRCPTVRYAHAHVEAGTLSSLRSSRMLAAGTGLRVVACPVVMALVLAGDYTPAAIVFVLAAATDWLDGRLARRWGVTTRLGAFLDTTADKLLVDHRPDRARRRAPRVPVGSAGHRRAGVHDPRAARGGRIGRAPVRDLDARQVEGDGAVRRDHACHPAP